jgi:hypothetical protein
MEYLLSISDLKKAEHKLQKVVAFLALLIQFGIDFPER